MKNFSKEFSEKITKNNFTNELQKVLEIFYKIIYTPQYIVYENKIGKNFREF